MAKKIDWKTPALGAFSLVTAFIIGGMFVNKTTTGNVVLGYVPSAVHPIVGWAIIVVASFLGIMGAYKLVTKK